MRLRNQKSYFRVRKEGIPPVKKGFGIVRLTYFALLILLVAYAVYYVSFKAVNIAGVGYVETDKYPVQAYYDGVLTEIHADNWAEVTNGQPLFTFRVIPDGTVTVVADLSYSRFAIPIIPKLSSVDPIKAAIPTKLDETRYSSVDGTVVRVKKKLREFVKEGDTILTIQVKENQEVVAFFDKDYMKYIEVGKVIDIKFPDGTSDQGKVIRFYSGALDFNAPLRKGYLPLENYVKAEIVPLDNSGSDWRKYDQVDVILKAAKWDKS